MPTPKNRPGARTLRHPVDLRGEGRTLVRRDGGEPAETVETSQFCIGPFAAGPVVTGDERIVRPLGEPEDRVARPLAEMVDLDQHVVGDQALNEVAPQARQAVGCCTAARPGTAASPAWRSSAPPGRTEPRSGRRCPGYEPPGRRLERDTSARQRPGESTAAELPPAAAATTPPAATSASTVSSPTTLRGMPVTLA